MIGRRIDPRYIPLTVTTIGTFMSVLDSTIVNIALPSILKDFDAGLGSGQLVITSYLMALAVIIPTSGFLGERVGMKRMYILTLIFFTAGSVLCGLAWNIESLVLFRVLQGLGGGMLLPLSMALVFQVITPLERPKFMALLGLPALIGPLVGPTLGGFLVQYASWRVVFLINLPIGVLDIILAFLILKETPKKHETRLDWRGLALATVSFPAILLGLTVGEEQSWTSPVVPVLVGGGLAALGGFIWVETHQHDPLLRLHLFGDSLFRRALTVQWIGFFSLFGLNFLMPLALQQARGLGAAEAGQILLPMGIAAFLTMNIAARFYNRVGPRVLATGGLIVLALSTVAWAQINETTPIAFLCVMTSLRGVGLGMFGQSINLTAYNAIAASEIPRATALVNMCTRMVGALSTAILTTLLGFGLILAGAPGGTSVGNGSAPIGDTLFAFRLVFLVMTAMSVIGIIPALFLHDRVLEASKREAKEKALEPVAVTGESLTESLAEG